MSACLWRHEQGNHRGANGGHGMKERTRESVALSANSRVSEIPQSPDNRKLHKPACRELRLCPAAKWAPADHNLLPNQRGTAMDGVLSCVPRHPSRRAAPRMSNPRPTSWPAGPKTILVARDAKLAAAREARSARRRQEEPPTRRKPCDRLTSMNGNRTMRPASKAEEGPVAARPAAGRRPSLPERCPGVLGLRQSVGAAST